jgi:SAM-dependent methyltransferase
MRNSYLRDAEHKLLRDLLISGKVIDLGGDYRSEYRRIIKGDISWTTVNLNPDAKPDLVYDLEKPLPIEAEIFDVSLLVNVLEHIYNYKLLLKESFRITKNKGKVVVLVPFMFPNHPSPQDFHRFTKKALIKEMIEAGAREVQIYDLGTGVFSARHLFLNRLLPSHLRYIHAIVFGKLANLLDSLFFKIAKSIHKQYDPSDYALGFMTVGIK